MTIIIIILAVLVALILFVIAGLISEVVKDREISDDIYKEVDSINKNITTIKQENKTRFDEIIKHCCKIIECYKDMSNEINLIQPTLKNIMESENMKKYCENCIHLNFNPHNGFNCTASENMKCFSTSIKKACLEGDPNKINKNNDCPFFSWRSPFKKPSPPPNPLTYPYTSLFINR